jgi:uncharacterized protein (TIGR00375 family)
MSPQAQTRMSCTPRNDGFLLLKLYPKPCTLDPNMAYVADLHIHSRFAGACSGALNIPNLATWAKFKGIDLLGSGDALHPLYQQELKRDLKDAGEGIYENKGTKFIISAEISCIYSEGGKLRRIHLIILFPSLDTAFQLSEALNKKGAKLASDGRPILGMSSKQICDIVFSLEPKSIVIPAHCVLPSTLIHTAQGMKQIKDVQKGDLVYTHKNRKRKVTEILKHNHQGQLIKIQSWYFSLGLEATSEHPFYGFKTKKCPSTGDTCLPSLAHQKICQHNFYKDYYPEWIKAEDLRVGDILAYPRFTNTTPMPSFSLSAFSPERFDLGIIKTRTKKEHLFEPNLIIDENFCRLVGYYLAEGWVTSKGEIGFCFNSKEQDYVNDVIDLVQKVFKINHHRIYTRKTSQGTEILFASRFLVKLFSQLFYQTKPHRAGNKTLPEWMLHLPINLQSQLLLGWWRGDAGYTNSRSLMNQMKVICLRLGIIPSIGVDSAEKHLKRGNHFYQGRTIQATTDLYHFSHLAFFEDPFGLLKEPIFTRFQRKLQRRHGWIDKDYVYLPIRKITSQEFAGQVMNLEVEEDHSYLTEFATVHNCWTPWYSLYGSNSGYDLLTDCFGEFSELIYAVETGLSSEPAMNWRIKELDNKSIVSFSDLHSLPRLGREVTMIGGSIKYESLRSALKNQNIIGTIEFFPEEGKYHYSGHRNCGVVLDSEQLKKNGEICPKCHRKLTIGVLQRVEELATRSKAELRIQNVEGITKSGAFPDRPGFRMLIQLEEIIGESYDMAVKSQKVQKKYEEMVQNIDSELKILTKTPIELLSMTAGERIAEGIQRVRSGQLEIEPGYDNTYGVVKIWTDQEKTDFKKDPQTSLF